MTLKEESNFTVTYCGNSDAVKTVDLTEAFEGIEGAIKHAYSLVNGKPDSEVTVTICEVQSENTHNRELDVKVSVKTESQNKYSLDDILGTLGFLGKR
jgi:hypothetical protein